MHSTKIIWTIPRKAENPTSCLGPSKSLPLWNRKWIFNFFFFHLGLLTVYWFTLFSQQFSDRFPNVDSVNSLIFILWLPLKMKAVANFGLGLRTQEPQSPSSITVEFSWITTCSSDGAVRPQKGKEGQGCVKPKLYLWTRGFRGQREVGNGWILRLCWQEKVKESKRLKVKKLGKETHRCGSFCKRN